MMRYGALARAVGEQFEAKWLHRAESLGEEVLLVPDFSGTTDLYGVVANINNIRVIPVGAVDLYALLGAALIPGIPVVIGAIPFDKTVVTGRAPKCAGEGSRKQELEDAHFEKINRA